ncbi:unnamed protein product [Rotaria socialis]|uniref:Calponin-homology (CH) domain-containing protein n=2 Tax=Rotaria socialis TaxID=392032 RepID=A0A818E4S4_9BILA|nr:unnamed protein product [Rotaria socialis]CAF4187324.1 unnamed protein product [Rotaria socialis]
MDERDEVEWPEQQPQYRQLFAKKNKSDIKQEKKMSKTESRFKSKLESLKKFQHSASTNGAVEKARAFFRSLELTHIGGSGSSSSDHSSSFHRRTTTTTTTTTNSNNNNNNNNNNNDNNNIHLLTSSILPLPSSMSSSSSSSIIDDSHHTISSTTNDSSFKLKNPPNDIAKARVIRVINPNYINPKDMIVHRVLHNEQDHHQFTSSYCYAPQILSQKKIPSPKEYNERSQSFSIRYDKHRDMQTKYDTYQFSPVSAPNGNIKYSTNVYSNFPSSVHTNINNNGNISINQMSTSLYNYRPLVCRQLESASLMSSSFHEQSQSSLDPLIRPLSSSASSSSMSTWTQSVRRLNTEYASTISALQQAKDSLKQIYPSPPDTISQYANIVARGINDLSNNEIKKSSGITVCLTAPIISQDSHSLSSQIPKVSIPQGKASPSTMFCKPKLVRPVELGTFVPSTSQIPKLESISTVSKINDKADSIANIIKKFNNLNSSSPLSKCSTVKDNINDSLSSEIKNEHRESLPKSILCESTQYKKEQSNISLLPSTTDMHPTISPRVQFEPSITTYELDDIPYESPASPLGSSSSSSVSQDSTSSTSTSSNDENQVYENQVYENLSSDNHLREETTYTVETFYKSANGLPSNNQQVVIIRENATEEQFNLAKDKQCQDTSVNHQTPSQHTYSTNENKISPLTTPMCTNLNQTIKQTTPTPFIIENQDKTHENYHSAEPLSHITNSFISDSYLHKDNLTIDDVVTINPHTHSPTSYCLISSSSSSSSSTATTSSSSSSSSSASSSSSSSSSSSNTASSASTVLLSSSRVTIIPTPLIVTKTPISTNINLTKNTNKSISQLPKRTTTVTTSTSTVSNGSRLKQPSKVVTYTSKLKPPSSTITKPMKSMIANSTPAVTTTMTTLTMRKSTGTPNQSSPMTNNIFSKTTPEQPSSSSSSPLSSISSTGKKQQLVNGTNMTESQNPTDSSLSMGKNRVRSMVNQFNAAVSSSRPTIPSTIPIKRTSIPTVSVTARRAVPTESTTSSAVSTNKPTITSTVRPPLQRALTINNSPITPSPPSTPPTMNNTISSTYKRKTPLVRSTSNVKEGLLRWCQAQVIGYPNVSVTNLSSSWADGLAFCALTHHFFPDAFDFNSLSSANRKENFELAFSIAEERAGAPQLLDVSDMLIMGNKPDDKCIFTYLNSFLAKVKDIHPTTNCVERH